jgi:putative addiction module component (TIGR02574 family)
MTVESLLRQAEALTPDERRELAARLLEVDDMSADPPLSDAMRAELRRRVADSDANPGSGIPWEVVYAESLKRARG